MSELLDDEEIIIKSAAIISTFRIMYHLHKPYIEAQMMDKLLERNIEDIFNRINEDDESLLKLTKDIGKIYYCIHKFYPLTFQKLKHKLAEFYMKHLSNEEDYQL